jgi:hypothetical protein
MPVSIRRQLDLVSNAVDIGMDKDGKDSEESQLSTQSRAISNTDTHHVRLFNSHSLLLWVSDKTFLGARPLMDRYRIAM